MAGEESRDPKKMATRQKLGISLRSLARDASDFGERISEVAKFQPDSIELSCFAQDLIRNGQILTHRTEQMRSVLDDYTIPATMHGPLSFNLLDNPENVRQHVQLALSYVELGAALGISAMVIHTGYCSENEPLALKRKYTAQRDGLKEVADYAGTLGIKIYLENIFPFFEGAHTALPEKLAEEIATIDHPQLTGCFDVSHAYIACNAYESDLAFQAKQISSVSSHWHVHDSFGQPLTSLQPYTSSEALAYGIGDLHLAVGDGDLPWDDVLSAAEISENMTFNIELHPELWSDMPHCVAATRRLMVKAFRLSTP